MATKKKAKKKATPLDGLFHYVERGGTFGGEIAAGVGMALVSVCGIFMNMQLVAQLSVTSYAESSMSEIAVNGEVYAMTWLASMIVAFVGTLVMGLVARRPLVQVTSLGLSTVLVSTVSLNTGLTYYNMLAICFVANVVYLVVAALPQLRRLVVGSLPASVRAALPAAAGLLMAFVAAQLTGLFQVGSSVIPNYGTAANLGAGAVATSSVTPLSGYSFLTDTYHPQMLLSALAVLIVVVVFLVSRRRAKMPFARALAWGTIFFLVGVVLFCGINWNNFNFALSSFWARLWMVGAEDAMQAHLSAAFANLALGEVLTQGFDFSGFTGNGGNVVTLLATGILSYVFLFISDADSTLVAVAAEKDEVMPDADDAALPMLLNAGTNVVAGLVGASPVALGKESVMGSRDGARSGLSAVVASVVFLVSAFVWIVPALLATVTSYSISFNMYGHYGYTMQLLAQTSFSVADAVMMIVGISMALRAVSSADVDLRDAGQAAPFAATVATTFLLTNLAAGLAAGVLAHVLVNLSAPRRRKGQPEVSPLERVGGAGTLAFAAVSLVLLVLVIL